MRIDKFNKLQGQLRDALTPKTINALAFITGFGQRLRSIEPAALTRSLLTCLGAQRIETLADFHRVYQAQTDSDVRYDSFHVRLSHPCFADFMCAVLNHTIGFLSLQALRALPSNPFRRFRRILIQDGTNFALHNSLAKLLPGRFFQTQPAAVALHTTIDLFCDDLQQVMLTPDTWPERDFLPPPSSLRGSILLADRGYGSASYFQAVAQAGGHYLIRGVKRWNPVVKAVWHNGQLQPLAKPTRLKAFLADPTAAQMMIHRFQGRGRTTQVVEAYDLQVFWPVDKVHYVGRVIWQIHAKDPVYLWTNLPWTEFDITAVLQGYRLRWQVELLFKEWKSYANLQAFETRSKALAIGMIWASITAAVLKRFLAHAAQIVYRVPISTRKTAMLGRNWLTELILAVQQGFQHFEQIFWDCLESIAKQAKRACRKKEHKRGRLQLGFAPVYNI